MMSRDIVTIFMHLLTFNPNAEVGAAPLGAVTRCSSCWQIGLHSFKFHPDVKVGVAPGAAPLCAATGEPLFGEWNYLGG
jgi:hypothetical protein